MCIDNRSPFGANQFKMATKANTLENTSNALIHNTYFQMLLTLFKTFATPFKSIIPVQQAVPHSNLFFY